MLSTTDLHVHALPYDYYGDCECPSKGLARTATLIAHARAEAANCLLFDNGDLLQGNPLGDRAARLTGRARSTPHPMIAAMNTLGYDAATLGNHDFNYGLDVLLTALQDAQYPVVSANVARALPGDAPLWPAYVLLDRKMTDDTGVQHTLRIGVIGFCPPQIVQWDQQLLSGRIVTRDIIDTARDLVPQMRAAGADVIVALSHSGIGPLQATPGMENASTALAAVPGIDAVVAGHSHLVFPSAQFEGMEGVDVAAGTLVGKPAVMAGFWGSHLGVIDLTLTRAVQGWSVTDGRSEARPIWARTTDRELVPLVASAAPVVAAVRKAHAATLRLMRRTVSQTKQPIHSYFALVADMPALHLVARAQANYVRHALGGTRWADLPILSAVAPFKAGGRGGAHFYNDIPAGPLALRHVADLYQYPNAIRAVRLSGAQVRAWLDRSACMFNQITPGMTDQPLMNPDFPSYDFDILCGVTWQIDLSLPARNMQETAPDAAGSCRITNLAHNGHPIDPDAEFIIATNSFRASGGGCFPGVTEDAVIFEDPQMVRDIVLRHVLRHGTAATSSPPAWRFAPLPGTSVWFDSGPGAVAHLDDLAALRAEVIGDAPDGFTRFRLHL